MMSMKVLLTKQKEYGKDWFVENWHIMTVKLIDIKLFHLHRNDNLLTLSRLSM